MNTTVERERGRKLLERLEAVRARARAYLAIDGAASIAVALVALGLVTFGVDRVFRLPVRTRGIILALAGASLAAIVYRKLVARLSAPMPLDEVARMVERATRAFDWRLVSAVQFLETEARDETSRELARRVVDEAEARAATVRFDDALDGGTTTARAGRGTVVLIAGVALVLGFPDVARTWFRRVVLLSSTEEWPKATRLRVLGFEEKHVRAIPRGTDFLVEVVAEGEVPLRATIDFQFPSGLGGTNPLIALEGGRFRAPFEHLDQDLTFTVRGGDDEKGPYVVRALRRPSLQSIEIAPAPPAYTKVKVAPFRAESGEVELPEGTRVTVSSVLAPGEPPKRLVKAWADVRFAGAKSEGPPLRVEGKLDARGDRFALDLVLERTATIGLDVEDQDGLGLERPLRFTLRARADAPPKVSLSVRGVGQMVTPEVTLPVEIVASDDYGLSEGGVRLKATGGGLEKPREEGYPIAELGREAREAKVELKWDLEPMKLAPGTVVGVQAQAKDGDPRGSKTTSSSSFAFRVVTPDELLTDLLRRQHEARRELERARDEEEKLAQGLAGRDQKTLERGGRTQRALQRTVGDIAQVIAQVVEEMKWNKLLDERSRTRLDEQVRKPLERLRDGEVAAAREAIDAAASAPEDERPAKMKEAAVACEAALAEMNAILERMRKIEDLTAIVARLRAIIKQQRDVMDETRRQREGK